jgi:hypothetical protein
MVQSLLWWLTSWFELYAILIFSLTLFRKPIQHKQLLPFACFLATIIYIVFFMLGLRGLVTVTNLTLITIFITLVFRLPFLKAFLITLIGCCISVVIEAGTLAGLVVMGLTTMEELASDKWVGAVAFLITGTILLLLTNILHRFKIGFLLRDQHFQKVEYLKPYNFLISILLIILLIAIVFINSKSDTFISTILMSALLSTSSFILIWYTYIQNKRLLEERYKHFNEIMNKQD